MTVFRNIARTALAAAGLAAAVALSGCTGTDYAGLDPSLNYPNINNVPTGALAQMTPEEEYAALTELNAALAAQPTMTPQQRKLYEARRRRLAEIASHHAIDTEKAIEAR